MGPTPPHDAVPAALSRRGRGASPPVGLEAVVARLVLGIAAAAVVAVIFGVELQQRGSAARELATELGSAAEATAAAASSGLSAGSPDAPGEATLAALGALAQLRGVERVTLLSPRTEDPLALDRNGRVEAAWRTPDDVPKGQALGPDRLRLTRNVDLPSGPDALLVVEASLELATQRHAEWVGASARMFVIVLLIVVALVPWLSRWATAPWTRAIARLHARVLGDTPQDSDPELALERVERAFEAQLVSARAAARRGSEVEAAQVATADDRDAQHESHAFLSNAGHELRTPLHAIVTTTSLLLETKMDVEQHALATRVLRSATVLSDSVSDLSELALLDSGTLEPEREVFDPEDLVEDVLGFGAPLAKERGLELLARIDLTVPRLMKGDPARLRRVLTHLVDNALRNTEEGAVDVRVVLRSTDPSNPQIVFEVQDTGVGIPPERHATILSEFTTTTTGLRGIRGGLGIGLALTARLTRALGGNIEFESTPGVGSTFRTSIPIESVSEAEHLFAWAGRRVLVLDDHPRSASHLIDLLVEEGAFVESEPTVYAGFEALVRGAGFDVVLVAADLAGRDALLGGVETLPTRGGVAPRIVLVHPILARWLPDRALDEAIACQIVKPITRRALRHAHEVAFEGVPTARIDCVAAPGPAPSERPKPELETAGAASAEDRAVKVLLVDDNETNRQLVQYLLGKRGYVVDIAVDGREAVDAFGLGEYDVILMDCQMPVMDGLEATRQIRSLERGRARRTPILAMSAGALGDDVLACRAAGMDDHIAKPFQPKEMLSWLEGWVARSLKAPGGTAPATDAPRRRVSAREAGLVAALAESGPTPALPAAAGAVDDYVLGPLLDDDDGRALAEELVATFVESGAEIFSGLARHLAAGDLADVAKIAHRFVSTSGSVGAVRLARLLREVETACDRGQSEQAGRLLGRAGDELEVARRILEARLGRVA